MEIYYKGSMTVIVICVACVTLLRYINRYLPYHAKAKSLRGLATVAIATPFIIVAFLAIIALQIIWVTL